MRKLLWVGDACVATGFARATHHICDWLDYRANPSNPDPWDVAVLGINYMGDPHQYAYPIYPGLLGGDAFGMGRLVRLTTALDIDLIVVQNDVWNIPAYTKTLQAAGLKTPVVGFLAVDGKNCQGWKLNDLALAIFWTPFAEHEARRGGYVGPSAIVPLGVDIDIYKPMDRDEARSFIELSPQAKSHPEMDGFFVGNVNRNQQRKRLDLTVEYFCEWVKSRHVDDAYLFVHACPTGEQEYDVEQLMEYYGLRDRLVFIQPNIGRGVPEAHLRLTYNWFDVQVNTGQGEGFGLTTLEGMACRVPQIVGKWAAFESLFCHDQALLIKCTTKAVTQGRVNVIGGVPDKKQFVNTFDALYRHRGLLEGYGQRGFDFVTQPQFRWENVGLAFSSALEGIPQTACDALDQPLEVAL